MYNKLISYPFRDPAQGTWLDSPITYKATRETLAPSFFEMDSNMVGGQVLEEDIELIKKVLSNSIDINEIGGSTKGRSVYLPLKKEFKLMGSTFRDLKLKGILYDQDPESLKTYSDRASLVDQNKFLLQVSENGEFSRIKDTPKPDGGLYLYEAVHEYKLMKQAFDLDLPVPCPLGVGAFTKLKYDGLRLGYILMAVPSKEDKDIIGFSREKLEALERSLVGTRREKAEKILMELGGLFIGQAALLRMMNDSGIVPFDRHPGNFAVHEDSSIYTFDFSRGITAADTTREQFSAYMTECWLMFFYNVYMIAEEMMTILGKYLPDPALVPYVTLLIVLDKLLTDEEKKNIGGLSIDPVVELRSGTIQAYMKIANPKYDHEPWEFSTYLNNPIARELRDISYRAYNKVNNP
ncbi:hypothetical protein ACFL5G_02820 [Candidatus Margulisiibacteriota bacterium]